MRFQEFCETKRFWIMDGETNGRVQSIKLANGKEKYVNIEYDYHE